MVDLAKKNTLLARVVLTLAGLMTLVILFMAGSHFYKTRWQADRAAGEAVGYLQKKDYQNAVLAARRALQLNGGQITAMDVMAQVAELGAQRDAILWRERIVSQVPQSLKERIALAATSVNLNEAELGLETLEKVKTQGEPSGEYQQALGKTEMALGKMDDALAHLTKATQIDPANNDFQLSLAEALLKQGHLEDRNQARATLEKLAAMPQYRLAATRLLLKDSYASGESRQAVKEARILAADTEATFDDKIKLLSLLRLTNDVDYPAYLEEIQKAGRADITSAVILVAWFNQNGLPREAIEWSKTLPPEISYSPLLKAVLSVSLIAMEDWQGLLDFVSDGNWEDMEYLRHALAAKAYWEMNRMESFQFEWSRAYQTSDAKVRAPNKLAKLAVQWGWQEMAANVLWTVANDPADAKWALALLYKQYLPGRKTHDLLKVTAKMRELSPDDDAVNNNWATYSLLCKLDTPAACATAAGLYQKHKQDGGYVSTYAYSLMTLGKSDEAVKVMETLGEETLKRPDVAIYYGIVLADAGQFQKAAQYLDIGASAKLLPEEDLLVAQARQKISNQNSTDADAAASPTASPTP